MHWFKRCLLFGLSQQKPQEILEIHLETSTFSIYLPNGLSCAPRIFTKILKPIYATLRSQGFENVGYIDDSYLQGGIFSDCSTNVAVTTKLFTYLGFILKHEKSVFESKQVITFLGFVLNSDTLTLALTPEKATKLVTKATTVLAKQSPSVREVAELIALVVSRFPGVMHGPLSWISHTHHNFQYGILW